jgi:hypothetical protein
MTGVTKNEPDALERVLEHLARDLQSGPAPQTSFILPVESVSDDRREARVRLCTGGTLDVPLAALNWGKALGHAEIGAQRLAIASGEIDRSTAAGRLLFQTAVELTRASGALRARTRRSPETGPTEPETSPSTALPLDVEQAPSVIKIPFWGVAGQPVNLSYTAPQFHYIDNKGLNYEQYPLKYITFFDCFLEAKPQFWFVYQPIPGRDERVITGFTFYVDSAHGTPFGQMYFGSVELSVTLVQETT